jgi:molybdate-binding protein
MPRWRLFGNAVLTFMTKLSSGYLKMNDPQNGYTVISRDALERIPLDRVYTGYGFLNDLLFQLNIHDFRVAHVSHAAVYGDEESGISYSSFVPSLSGLLFRNFVRRLTTKHLVRDFHPLVFCYLIGAVGLVTATLCGILVVFDALQGNGNLVAYAPAKGSGATTTLAETDGVVQMPAETSLLGTGETVAVERFDDTPLPSLLGVGAADPVFARLLDGFRASRFLSLAPADARRWLDDDIPDVLVTPSSALDDETAPLVRWERDWGLALPAGNPNDVDALSALVDTDLRFANLDDSIPLRHALENTLREAAADEGKIDGYHRELPGIESAARSVAAGRADTGLALRLTAERLDLEFLALGTQELALVANPDRGQKESVEQLRKSVDDRLPALLAETPGYAPVE